MRPEKCFRAALATLVVALILPLMGYGQEEIYYHEINVNYQLVKITTH